MDKVVSFYEHHPYLRPNAFVEHLRNPNKREEVLSLLFKDIKLGEEIFKELAKLTLEEDKWEIKKDFFNHELREDYLQRYNNILEDRLDRANLKIRKLKASNEPNKKPCTEGRWSVGKETLERSAGDPITMEIG
jgi:hypothetical protein